MKRPGPLLEKVRRVKTTKSRATFFDGEYGKKGSRKQCAALKANTGRRCKAYAVDGKAVCWMHGGANPGPPIQIGRYGRYASQSLQQKLNELYADVDYKSLKDELILLRGLIGEEFDRAKEAKKIPKTDKDGNVIYNKDAEVKAYKIIELVKEIRQTIESVERMENERSYMLSIKNVEKIMYAWITILSKHIHDVHTLVSIQKELSSTLVDGDSKQRLRAGDSQKDYLYGSRTGETESHALLPERTQV